MPSRTRATIPARCKPTWATKTSSTPCAIQSCRQRASKIFGATRPSERSRPHVDWIECGFRRHPEKYDGLAYGGKPRQKLDVYKPRHAAKAPVLVFFYGGSWQGGSRDLYPFVGTSLRGLCLIAPAGSLHAGATLAGIVANTRS